MDQTEKFLFYGSLFFLILFLVDCLNRSQVGGGILEFNYQTCSKGTGPWNKVLINGEMAPCTNTHDCLHDTLPKNTGQVRCYQESCEYKECGGPENSTEIYQNKLCPPSGVWEDYLVGEAPVPCNSTTECLRNVSLADNHARVQCSPDTNTCTFQSCMTGELTGSAAMMGSAAMIGSEMGSAAMEMGSAAMVGSEMGSAAMEMGSAANMGSAAMMASAPVPSPAMAKAEQLLANYT